MQPRSPTLEGFRALFRRPSVGLAEIAWRWSFGFAAALLLTFSFFEYLNTLPVSARDLFLFRTRQPALISQALLHIFRGSGQRAVEAAIVLGLALAVAWIPIAAMGRAVTLESLRSYLSERNATAASAVEGWRLRSLGGLNFLRVAATVAAALGLLASWLLGAAVSPESDPSPGLAVLIFLAVAMLVWLAWSAVNWLLSFAAVFVVAEGEDTFGAMAAALDLCLARPGPLFAAGTWFGLAHLVLFFVASSVVAIPLAFLSVAPGAVVLGGVLMVTCLYFAIVDYLYVGRLAAYLAIVETPNPPRVPNVAPPLPPYAAPPPENVDRDEVILSDVPMSDLPTIDVPK